MTNVLLGGAIGDSLGVPFETMKADNLYLSNWDGKTFVPSLPRSPSWHGPILKAGQISDDTQMSQMVAESLIENKGFNPDDISKRYIDWIISGRARGYGKSTLLAIQKLQSGVHWSKSGSEGSYGNGTAMRAAPFGVFFKNDLNSLIESVKIDSKITHYSNEAEAGALAIAIAAYYAINQDKDNLIEKITNFLPESKVKEKLLNTMNWICSDVSSSFALQKIGTGADVRETVPAALYCFLNFNNYETAVVTAIRAGGDTDTTGAIVGALFGAQFGIKGIDKKFYLVENFEKLVTLDSVLYNRSNSAFFPR